MIALAGLAGILATAACTHSEVHQHAAVAADAKTIAMPQHKRGLLRSVAEALVADGWKITLDPGAAPGRQKASTAKRSGRAEPETKSETKKPEAKPIEPTPAAPPKARYRLTAEFREIDYCRSGGRVLIYDLAIVDQMTGAKTLEQRGRECERDVVAKFKEALRAASAPR